MQRGDSFRIRRPVSVTAYVSVDSDGLRKPRRHHIVNRWESLNEITIEECGKSRIPLNGLVQDLHLANLHRLYEKLTAQRHG